MPDQSNPLTAKTVLITGATSGIGRATAEAFAAAGAHVAISGRRTDRLESLVEQIKSQGGQAHAFTGDITDEASVKKTVEEAATKLGGLDIIVNNAGVMLLGPVFEADTQDWRRMIETNVLGLMYATRAALDLMIPAKQGHIIQVSSVAGRHANAGSAVYNATKFAVNAFTEALRQEITASGIRTTLIEPGVVETELRQHITHAESKAKADDWAGSLRQLQSTDIAAGIIYAASQPDHVNVNEILIRPTDQVR